MAGAEARGQALPDSCGAAKTAYLDARIVARSMMGDIYYSALHDFGAPYD